MIPPERKSNKIMKTSFRMIGTLGFMAMLCLLVGCSLYYRKPTYLICKIALADHIVVTNCLHFTPPPGFGYGPSGHTNYSLTLTGTEAKDIIHAISTLRERREFYEMSSTALYDWRLRFYRGKLLLGEAGLCGDMVKCGDSEYHAPPVLSQLSDRIEKESMVWTLPLKN